MHICTGLMADLALHCSCTFVLPSHHAVELAHPQQRHCLLHIYLDMQGLVHQLLHSQLCFWAKGS